jgi:hypothetical protein
MGRLATIKSLAGFDFSFQPSLDRDRIFTLAQLGFVTRCEVVHFLGPPSTGKSHLAIALAVEAVKAGKCVYFCTLAELIAALARSEREGRLQERFRFFCRPALLVVDEIGYLPVATPAATCSSSSSMPAMRRAPWFSLQAAALPNGARSSETPSSQPHFSIACSTTRWSSRSRDRAIGSASTQSSCPDTWNQKPPYAAGIQRTITAARPAAEKRTSLRDGLTGQTGENSSDIDTCARSHARTARSASRAPTGWCVPPYRAGCRSRIPHSCNLASSRSIGGSLAFIAREAPADRSFVIGKRRQQRAACDDARAADAAISPRRTSPSRPRSHLASCASNVSQLVKQYPFDRVLLH